MKREKDKRRMNYEELKWIMCLVIKYLINSIDARIQTYR